MKYSSYYLRILLLLLAPLMIFDACNNNVSGTKQNSQQSKVKGRVANSSSSTGAANTNLSGMTVILAQVQADGSLNTVSTGNATTQADGSFEVSTDLDGVNNLVVVATNNGTYYSAIVDAKVKHGTTVTAPPLNRETTTETDVYQKIVNQGQESAVNTADIELYVDAQTTARVWKSDQDISVLANAIIAREKAMASALGSTLVNASKDQIQTIRDAKDSAAVDLQSSLYDAGNDTAMINNAYKAYFSAVVKGYVNAGLNTSDLTDIDRVSNTAYMNASTSLNAQARLAMKQQAALILSYAMRKEAQLQFQAAGAGQTEMNHISTASDSLEADIRNATDISGIVKAFTTFHDSLKASLKTSLSAHASVIDSIDTDINAQSGFKAQLQNAISSAGDATAIAKAYATFIDVIRTAVKNALKSSSQSDIDAVTRILIMTNLQF